MCVQNMKDNKMLISLQEIFDTTNQTLSWDKVGSKDQTLFTVEGEQFQLYIENFDLSELLHEKEYQFVYEVSFTKLNTFTGTKSYKSDGKAITSQSLAVFSIVINAVKSKIPHAEVIFFNAKKGDEVFESRKALYQRLTSSLCKRMNLSSLIKEYDDFELYVLSKNSINVELVDHLVKLI